MPKMLQQLDDEIVIQETCHPKDFFLDCTCVRSRCWKAWVLVPSS